MTMELPALLEQQRSGRARAHASTEDEDVGDPGNELDDEEVFDYRSACSSFSELAFAGLESEQQTADSSSLHPSSFTLPPPSSAKGTHGPDELPASSDADALANVTPLSDSCPAETLQWPVEARENEAAAAAAAAALLGSSLTVAEDALRVHAFSQTGCSDATKLLMRHAEDYGLQSLEDIENYACIIEKEGNRDAQQAATLKRLISAARGALVDLTRVDDDAGWQVVSDTAMKMKLMYKHDPTAQGPNSSVHCIKARADLEAPIENLTALLVEFDLIRTWNKYMVETTILKRLSLTGLLCLATVWLPWPFSNSDLIIEAVGLDLLREKQRCLFISFQSPPSLPDDVKLSAVHTGNRRLCILPGSYFHYVPLEPLAPGKPPRVRCCIESMIDPNLKHVPAFLVSFVLQVLAPFFYSTVASLLKRAFKNKDKDPLPKRMTQNPELYDIIRASAREALARQSDDPAGPGQVQKRVPSML